MAFSELYEAAKATLSTEPRTPGSYLVAVWDGMAEKESDPIWFKCGPNRKLSKVLARFLHYSGLDVEEGDKFILFQDGKSLMDENARVQEYDMHGENIVVLQAFSLSRMPSALRGAPEAPKVAVAPLDQSQQPDSLSTQTQRLSFYPSTDTHDANKSAETQSTAAGVWTASQLAKQALENIEPFDLSAFAGTLESLQHAVQSSNTASKEIVVQKCILLLKTIDEVIASQDESLDLQIWSQRAFNLSQSYERPQTVIGLLGQTGAGKSSLANALLDEEQIVPTSGMQACTAAPTQIAFNDLSDSHYRAEIEFIQLSEWERELKIFHDDKDSISEESPQKISIETASTLARVHTVHQNLRKNRIDDADICEALTQVQNILGTTKVFESNSCSDFNQTLQKYIFTKQKGATEDSEDYVQEAEELWPLVKLVRIYTKAETLATGAVLIDLPGLGDANAARANVARGHMGQCDFLWVLSAIKRAVDDETAKRLLGRSLNTQLVMDNSVNNTTFICTGTDDIRVTEFSHIPSLQALMSRADGYEKEKKSYKAAIRALRKGFDRCTDAEQRFDEQILELERRIQGIIPPVTPSKKRSPSPSETESAKKRKTTSASFIVVDDDDDDDDDDENAPSLSTPVKQDKNLLSCGRLEKQIAKLRERKEDQYLLKQEKRRLLGVKESELDDIELALSDARYELISTCIAERNRICKAKIRSDYVDCIKNIDEREMQRKDPDGYDPYVEFRDYNALGHKLPVFCTSSIAYQQLCGRYVKEREVFGFCSEEETEIPALKAHCLRLTEAPREAACVRFLIGFGELAGSFKLWAQNCEAPEHVVSQASIAREKSIDASLSRLEEVLKAAATDAISQLQSKLDQHIYKVFPAAIEQALGRVTNTREEWEALRWNTYKATCARSGVFKSSDWNQELLDPIMMKIARGWSRTFSSSAPKILESLAKRVETGLVVFQNEVQAGLEHMPLGSSEESLKMQVSSFKKALESLCKSTTEELNRSQKGISRKFKDLIQEAMEEAYAACCFETGPGCFKRMKDGMSSHVANVQGWMFNRSCDKVMAKLRSLIEETQTAMLDQVHVQVESLRHDYQTAIGALNREEDKPLRESRRNVARSIMHLLSSAINEAKQMLEEEARHTGNDVPTA